MIIITLACSFLTLLTNRFFCCSLSSFMDSREQVRTPCYFVSINYLAAPTICSPYLLDLFTPQCKLYVCYTNCVYTHIFFSIFVLFHESFHFLLFFYILLLFPHVELPLCLRKSSDVVCRRERVKKQHWGEKRISLLCRVCFFTCE